MNKMTLVGTGACSSDMLWGFMEKDPAKLQAAYAQFETYDLKKTTFALVSTRDEKPAYEFLLKKGWVDMGFYAGNSNGEMHLMARGMKRTVTENPVKKAIRKRVRLPLSRLRKKIV